MTRGQTSNPLFSEVRGREILGSLHAVSCIENGASKPESSLLSESTPGDRHLHIVVLDHMRDRECSTATVDRERATHVSCIAPSLTGKRRR
jgi:hypothetical protein